MSSSAGPPPKQTGASLHFELRCRECGQADAQAARGRCEEWFFSRRGGCGTSSTGAADVSQATRKRRRTCGDTRNCGRARRLQGPLPTGLRPWPGKARKAGREVA